MIIPRDNDTNSGQQDEARRQDGPGVTDATDKKSHHSKKHRNRTVEEYLKAIEGSGGIYSIVAERLGVNRVTAWRRIKNNKVLLDAMEQETERMGDVAEAMLFKKIKQGDMTALIFYLKTKHKHRGYVERSEVAGEIKQPVVLNFVPADSSKKKNEKQG